MKTLRSACLAFALVVGLGARAETDFPGLRAIMSESAWKKARLDRLDADDLRLIDEAFADYLRGSRPAAPAEPAPAVEAPIRAASLSAPASGKKRSMWERFGLAASEDKPVETPIMTAKVVAWHNTNGIVLDNGQVWDALDPIRDELVGREIGIRQGRLGSFLLLVEGEDVSVRLHRVK